MKSKMIQTTGKICQKCKYILTNGHSGKDMTCMYLEITGKRRGCPVGWCDKYEPKKKRRSGKEKA